MELCRWILAALGRWVLPALFLTLVGGAGLGCSKGSGPGPVEPPDQHAVRTSLSAGEYLLVLNRDSRDISVLSAADGYAEIRRIPLPQIGILQPWAMEVDAANGTIYLSYPDSVSSIVALDLNGIERARTEVVGWSPDLALDRNRGLVAVAAGRGVEFLDAASLASRGRVKTGSGSLGAWHIALDAETGRAIVAHALADEVVVVSTDELRVTARISVNAYPRDVEILNGIAYVSAFHADWLDVVSIQAGGLLTSLPTGNGPASLAAASASGRVFVSHELTGQLMAMDATTRTETARWNLRHGIRDIALNSAGSLLFTCHTSQGLVNVIDAATGAEIASATVGASPVVVRAVALR
jgi:DNA-binding beta-propeller fold protein YncE